MVEQIITWSLGILATLFGGLNIFQWLTLRSYKRVKAAEADKAEIDTLRTIIESNQAEIGRLSQRLLLAEQREVEMRNKYDELYQRFDSIRDEFETYKINHK